MIGDGSLDGGGASLEDGKGRRVIEASDVLGWEQV